MPADPPEGTSPERPNLRLLADFDAGIVTADNAAEALTHPGAGEVLRALATTRAELAGHSAPPVPPSAIAAWNSALTAESGQSERSDRTSLSLSLRRRRRIPRPALAAAALLIALLGAAELIPQPAMVTLPQLATVAMDTIGTRDAGGLDDPTRRAGCLRAVRPGSVDPAVALLGARHVEYEGRPGVLMVLATGRLGSFHVVVVDPGCGPEGGTLLGYVLAGR
ncbi:hypothetical protein [Pseudonocardia sp. TRM90224]|uniref:hypothetical protein n=1 Tax=Pseudonocardia sp. TRM90224 TaxID=2812678 RepID=UPI001E603201|nr:hypothetical protein [Pseudonocardia sp. TRM90224]